MKEHKHFFRFRSRQEFRDRTWLKMSCAVPTCRAYHLVDPKLFAGKR